MPISLEQMEEYRALRRSNQARYIHCPECFDQRPDNISPQQWSQFEVIIDLVTDNIYLGCRRCELPIVIQTEEDN